MAIPSISTPNVSAIKSALPSLPPKPSIPTSIKVPKGIAPVKIDVTTGKGVPGGFDASSVKLPSLETAKLSSTIASISSKAGGITAAISAVKAGLIPPIPGLMEAKSKLDGLKSKAMKKLSGMAKVPDFTKNVVLPKAPALPAAPDFKSLGIPDIPAIPSTPALPNVASLPTVPSVSLPNASSLPTLPSVSIPKIGT